MFNTKYCIFVFLVSLLHHTRLFILVLFIYLSFFFKEVSSTLFCYIFFFHSCVEGHIGCSQFIDIYNRAAINTIKQVSLWQDEVCFEHMTKSSIVEL